MELFEALTKIRRAQNLTIADVSQRSGLPMSTLSKVFSGISDNPSYSAIVRIAAAMGVTPNDICRMQSLDQPVIQSSAEQPITVGERIKDARIKKGITQQQLASYIGVAKSTVAGYETNQRSPDLSKISTIAKILDVSSDYLIGVNHLSQSLSPVSLELARQYDALDERSQAFIRLVMEHELLRVSSSQESST